jgi:hypothetical protein
MVAATKSAKINVGVMNASAGLVIKCLPTTIRVLVSSLFYEHYIYFSVPIQICTNKIVEPNHLVSVFALHF